MPSAEKKRIDPVEKKVRRKDRIASLEHQVALLRERQEFIRLALEGTDEGVWEARDDDLSLDDNFPRLLGYEPLPGKFGFDWWFGSLHPESREEFINAIALHAAGGRKYYELEYRIRDSSGNWRWIWTRGVISAHDAAGKPSRMIGTYRDVTERKKAEDALGESEGRYRDLYENSSDWLCLHNLQGNIISVNPAAAQGMGYEEAQMIGVNIRDTLRPKDRGKFDAYLETVNKAGYAAGYMAVKTRAGETRVLEYRNSLRIRGVPEPIVRGIARDVTEQWRSRRALEQSERNYRHLADQSPAYIVLFAADGRITYMNPIAQAACGYALEEIGGRNIIELVPPEQLNPAKEMMDKRRKGDDSTFFYTGDVLTKDGGRIAVEATISPITDGEAYLAELIIARDVTYLKEMEREKERSLLQRQKYQKLEAIGILAGGIAHDFNNILAVIQGSMDLLKMELSPQGVPHDRIALVERSVRQAQEVTGRLLTFSRGGKPQRKPYDISTDIKEIAKAAVNGFSVTLAFHIPDDLWILNADASQMRQVIRNLVVNAAEAMPAGGAVAIRLENMSLASSGSRPVSAGDYVRLTVSDTGVGISPPDLANIFDPYFTTKKKGALKGIGLGLSVCHSIIANHDGYINISSELGKGTVIEVFLPTLSMSVNGLSPLDAIPGHKPKILIMDDEEMIRTMMKDMLELSGCRVVTAQKGEEAIEIFRTALSSGQPFDAVMLDLTVRGGMGGKLTVKHLSELDRHVRAVIVSGYSDDHVLNNYKAYGFCGALIKPFTMEMLKEVLEPIITMPGA